MSVSTPREASTALRPHLSIAAFGLAALAGLMSPAAHAAPVLGQGTWETVLKARDINGQAVALDDASAAFFYDSQANITWQRAMSTGKMNWSTAVAWADGLTTGGFTDWRLPAVIDSGTAGCNWSYAGGTDCGYNVETQVNGAYSEWAHLYYSVLGRKAYYAPGTGAANQPGWDLENTAYFQNMQANIYWSGTEYVGSGAAWGFSTVAGDQGGYGATGGLYAAAVRTGDVLRGAGTVPEPQSLALALGALGMLGLARRARSAALVQMHCDD